MCACACYHRRRCDTPNAPSSHLSSCNTQVMRSSPQANALGHIHARGNAGGGKAASSSGRQHHGRCSLPLQQRLQRHGRDCCRSCCAQRCTQILERGPWLRSGRRGARRWSCSSRACPWRGGRHSCRCDSRRCIRLTIIVIEQLQLEAKAECNLLQQSLWGMQASVRGHVQGKALSNEHASSRKTDAPCSVLCAGCLRAP